MAKKYNCTKNGIQYFRKTKVVGHKPNGKPIVKEFYGDGEKDADHQIEEYMNNKNNGLNVDTQNLTIEEAMHQWLFDTLLLSKNKKSASFEKHECNYRNYIKDRKIGCIKVFNAVSRPFQLYYNDLYKNGLNYLDVRSNKIKHIDVTSNKIFDLNKTLRAFFNYCIKQKYTLDNPCLLGNIEIPGNADGDEDESDELEEEILAFSDNEISILTSNLKYVPEKDNTFKIMIYFGLITGLRQGELLGLKKKFLEKYIVKVRNTLKRLKVFDTNGEWHYELKLIKPKSKTSIRNVNFPIAFWNTLELYLKEQEIKWEKNGLNFNDDSLLFTTNSCKPINSTNFTRAWRRFLKRINIEYKKPHSLRDTYATTLVRKGASILDVKSLLGHSSIKITEKYYLFVFPEDKSTTANLLNDLII